MLNFIGSGSAFNTGIGNNSTFLKINKSLILIDCGSSTFSRLRELNVLDGVEHVRVFITHTHPDHVGSLGDLIFYVYYVMKKRITVHTPPGIGIVAILRGMGVSLNLYTKRA